MWAAVGGTVAGGVRSGRAFVCGTIIRGLLSGFLARFVEQLAEGIAKALAGVEVDRGTRAWGRGRSGLGHGFGRRLRNRGGLARNGRLVGLRAAGLTGISVRVPNPGITELFFEEIRNGERLLGRVCRGGRLSGRLPRGRIFGGWLLRGFLQDAFERFEQGSSAGCIGGGGGGGLEAGLGALRAGVFSGLRNHGSAGLRTIAASERRTAG